jgi:hypothetical protein
MLLKKYKNKLFYYAPKISLKCTFQDFLSVHQGDAFHFVTPKSIIFIENFFRKILKEK